jgi:23S rRNA-intervening sequence protein
MDAYRELKVWQLGVEISLAVYKLTEGFPQREMYGLSSQMRRAEVSIPYRGRTLSGSDARLHSISCIVSRFGL